MNRVGEDANSLYSMVGISGNAAIRSTERIRV